MKIIIECTRDEWAVMCGLPNRVATLETDMKKIAAELQSAAKKNAIDLDAVRESLIRELSWLLKYGEVQVSGNCC